jgi:hypothetical protein
MRVRVIIGERQSGKAAAYGATGEQGAANANDVTTRKFAHGHAPDFVRQDRL